MDKKGIKVVRPKEASEGDIFFEQAVKPKIESQKQTRTEKPIPKSKDTTVIRNSNDIIVSRKGITVIVAGPTSM